MKLSDILSLIKDVANKSGTSTPYIVGGVPRDKILNKLNYIDDIDITTGDNTIHNLSKEVDLSLDIDHDYNVLDDGHAQIIINGFKLDFSSNFKIPNVNKMLTKAGFKKPNSMQEELYSRDFTCNALLMSLSLDNIYDITGLSLQDIKNKKIRTCLPAAITLGYDNKRAIRAFYLAAKLNFEIDPEILDWIKNNPKSISEGSKQYVQKKLLSALKYDKEKTIKYLNDLNLFPYLPVTEDLLPYIKQNIKSAKKKDKRVDLDVRPYPSPIFKNYDYSDEELNDTSPGGGLYHGKMDKYKSVRDFLEQRRKKRKNKIKALEK